MKELIQITSNDGDAKMVKDDENAPEDEAMVEKEDDDAKVTNQPNAGIEQDKLNSEVDELADQGVSGDAETKPAITNEASSEIITAAEDETREVDTEKMPAITNEASSEITTAAEDEPTEVDAENTLPYEKDRTNNDKLARFDTVVMGNISYVDLGLEDVKMAMGKATTSELILFDTLHSNGKGFLILSYSQHWFTFRYVDCLRQCAVSTSDGERRYPCWVMDRETAHSIMHEGERNWNLINEKLEATSKEDPTRRLCSVQRFGKQTVESLSKVFPEASSIYLPKHVSRGNGFNAIHAYVEMEDEEKLDKFVNKYNGLRICRKPARIRKLGTVPKTMLEPVRKRLMDFRRICLLPGIHKTMRSERDIALLKEWIDNKIAVQSNKQPMSLKKQALKHERLQKKQANRNAIRANSCTKQGVQSQNDSCQTSNSERGEVRNKSGNNQTSKSDAGKNGRRQNKATTTTKKDDESVVGKEKKRPPEEKKENGKQISIKPGADQSHLKKNRRCRVRRPKPEPANMSITIRRIKTANSPGTQYGANPNAKSYTWENGSRRDGQRQSRSPVVTNGGRGSTSRNLERGRLQMEYGDFQTFRPRDGGHGDSSTAKQLESANQVLLQAVGQLKELAKLATANVLQGDFVQNAFSPVTSLGNTNQQLNWNRTPSSKRLRAEDGYESTPKMGRFDDDGANRRPISEYWSTSGRQDALTNSRLGFGTESAVSRRVLNTGGFSPGVDSFASRIGQTIGTGSSANRMIQDLGRLGGGRVEGNPDMNTMHQTLGGSFGREDSPRTGSRNTFVPNLGGLTKAMLNHYTAQLMQYKD